jgi:hypothetical protein
MNNSVRHEEKPRKGERALSQLGNDPSSQEDQIRYRSAAISWTGPTTAAYSTHEYFPRCRSDESVVTSEKGVQHGIESGRQQNFAHSRGGGGQP